MREIYTAGGFTKTSYELLDFIVNNLQAAKIKVIDSNADSYRHMKPPKNSEDISYTCTHSSTKSNYIYSSS